MDDVPPLTCSRPVMLVARASPIEIMPTQMSGHTKEVDFNGNVLSLEPSAPTAQPLPMWTVDQVVNFVASVPECKEYAEVSDCKDYIFVSLCHVDNYKPVLHLRR